MVVTTRISDASGVDMCAKIRDETKTDNHNQKSVMRRTG
jgi:hypothetical protein